MRAGFLCRRDRELAGLRYTVQFSRDLATWHDSADEPEIIATDAETEVCALPFPLLRGGVARYVRVRVTGLIQKDRAALPASAQRLRADRPAQSARSAWTFCPSAPIGGNMIYRTIPLLAALAAVSSLPLRAQKTENTPAAKPAIDGPPPGKMPRPRAQPAK